MDPIRLSPNGSRVAAPTGSAQTQNTTTDVYENGVLISAMPGYPLAWIDEERLLVLRYNAGAQVYDVQGVPAGPALPHFTKVRVMPNGELYSQRHNAIYSLTTGRETWAASGLTNEGSIAGRHAVFVPQTTVDQVVTQLLPVP